MNTAVTPYFAPILRSAGASNCLAPTAARSCWRSPSSTKRVPGCADCTCSWNCRVARALRVSSALEAKSTIPTGPYPLRSTFGGTGTTTVLEHAANTVAASNSAAERFMFFSLFEWRWRDTTRGRLAGQSETPGAGRGRLKQLAHPGGGAQRAAEAVEMDPDRIACLSRQGVARHRDQLVARVGVGDELRDAGAKGAQRAQRAAHTTALGIAQELHRIGRAGDAHVHRHVRPAACEARAVLDHPHGRKRNLGQDVDADRLCGGELELALERLVDGVSRDARMPLRIAGDADLAHAAVGEQPLLQDLQAVDKRPLRARLVATDQQHAMHAVIGRRVLQEIAEFVAVEDATRRDVRHRVETRLAHRRDRLESARERQAGKRRYVHARIRGQERRHVLRAMQVARRDLE